MGRKTSADVESKRKPVKVRLLDREHGGKVIEVYRMMEDLIADHHTGMVDGVGGIPVLRNLDQARIVIAQRSGWKPDVDGVLILARIRKASEADKYLFGAECDYVIELNAEAWPALSDDRKRQVMDHELYHAAPDLDRDGQQKIDARERLCWRVRKHYYQEHREIIERYGVDECLNLNAVAVRAAEDSERPLLAGQDGGEANGNKNDNGTPPGTLPDEVETSILHLSNQGLSMRKIAAQTGVSERRVRTVLGKL